MANLFKTAKANASKVEKKNDKLVVNINDVEVDQALVKMVDLESKIDQLNAELEMVKGVVKEAAMKAFVDTYTKTGGYPGSFNIKTPSATIMAVPMDKYIKCDEARFNELKDTYGDDVVTEKTEFVLNAALIDKYGEVLSEMIENCDRISDDDKAELIQAKVAYSVSKGAIEKAFTWGKGEVDDFIRDIQPIFATKSAKISK